MKRRVVGMFAASLATVTVLAFQNCGIGFKTSEQSVESSSSVDKTDPFFEYSYGATPEFYVDAFIFRPTAAASLAEFKFLGVVAKPSSHLDDINYIVTFKDVDGTTVCPMLMGTLLGGASSIISDCVTTRVPASVTVKIVLESMGQQYLLERTY